MKEGFTPKTVLDTNQQITLYKTKKNLPFKKIINKSAITNNKKKLVNKNVTNLNIKQTSSIILKKPEIKKSLNR